MSTYTNTGLAVIDNQMAQNAYVIGHQIAMNTLNTSRWFTVIQKGTLPAGLGDNLASLVYNKSIPTTTAGGSTLGVTWARVGRDITSAQNFDTATNGQTNNYAAGSHIGTTGVGTASLRSFVDWTKIQRNYFLERAEVQSPYVQLMALYQAAALDQQIAAVMEALDGSTRWVWERRFQEQYETISANFVPCLISGTPIRTTVDADTDGNADDLFYGKKLTDLDLVSSGADNSNVVPTAGLSNKVLDRIKTRLDIVTPLNRAYGQDNGKAVHLLMIGDDASYAIKTESGIRDDVRKSSRVDDLLKPLGVDESFRGFFHMCLPDPPRFTESSGALTRIEPLDKNGQYNAAYDTATYEAAYVIHKDVMESQVPMPNISSPGFKFDPQNFAGEFDWINIKSDVANPKGEVGFFLGTFASAAVPKKVEYGYVILFKRDAAPAA